MVINLLPTGHKEQFRESFVSEVISALREPNETSHEVYIGDYYLKVDKKFITDVDSADKNWEHGVINYEFGYTDNNIEVNPIKGRFAGITLVFAANPEIMIADRFDYIYTRLINNVLTQAEAKEYYDELDY